jgi:hypothetical protein
MNVGINDITENGLSPIYENLWNVKMLCHASGQQLPISNLSDDPFHSP